MATLDYKNLLNKTMSVSPYRGTNEYPMGNRSSTYARFGREDDGSYKIYYHHAWEYQPISEETYKALKGVNGVEVCSKQESGRHWVEHEYSKLVRTRNHVATVRADNTLEFVASDFHQGLRMKFTDWTKGIVYQNNRLGGVVYQNKWGTSPDIVVPLFRGLIIDLETMLPKQNVQVFRRKVDRKKAKEIMKPYSDMLKIAETMVGNMPPEMLFSTAKELLEEHGEYLAHWGDGKQKFLHCDVAYDKADKLRHEGQLFDSAVLYMMGASILNQWNVRDFEVGKRNWWLKEDSHYYSDSLVRMLPKLMYRREEPFYEEEVKVGAGYKPSVWGMRILCDGVEVKQY